MSHAVMTRGKHARKLVDVIGSKDGNLLVQLVDSGHKFWAPPSHVQLPEAVAPAPESVTAPKKTTKKAKTTTATEPDGEATVS